MWFLHAVTISSADLFFIGMQKVYPVSMQTAVSAYLFPFEEGGGIHQLDPYLQIPLAELLVQIFVFQIVFLNLLYCTSLTAFTVPQHMCSHSFPVGQMLDCCICPLASIVSRLVVAQMKYNILQ